MFYISLAAIICTNVFQNHMDFNFVFYFIAFVTTVALSTNVLGYDTTLDQPSWCWINPIVSNALFWQFFTGKFWEIISYIATVVLYSIVKCFIWKKVIYLILVSICWTKFVLIISVQVIWIYITRSNERRICRKIIFKSQLSVVVVVVVYGV